MESFREMSKEELQAQEVEVNKKYQEFKDLHLSLNMARGKPAPDQIDHANGMLETMTDYLQKEQPEIIQKALKEKHLGLIKTRKALTRILDRLRNIIRTFSWD